MFFVKCDIVTSGKCLFRGSVRMVSYMNTHRYMIYGTHTNRHPYDDHCPLSLFLTQI